MNFLTDRQKDFIRNRKIEAGLFYMFPRWGFMVYETPDFEGNFEFIDTNPFTRTLDHEYFQVKEITDNNFVRGNFKNRPNSKDFYLDKEELSRRGNTEIALLLLILFIPFTIYNIFSNDKD